MDAIRIVYFSLVLHFRHSSKSPSNYHWKTTTKTQKKNKRIDRNLAKLHNVCCFYIHTHQGTPKTLLHTHIPYHTIPYIRCSFWILNSFYSARKWAQYSSWQLSLYYRIVYFHLPFQDTHSFLSDFFVSV